MSGTGMEEQHCITSELIIDLAGLDFASFILQDLLAKDDNQQCRAVCQAIGDSFDWEIYNFC